MKQRESTMVGSARFAHPHAAAKRLVRPYRAWDKGNKADGWRKERDAIGAAAPKASPAD